MLKAAKRFEYSNQIFAAINHAYRSILTKHLVKITDEHFRLTGRMAYIHDGKCYYSKPMKEYALNMVPRGLTTAPLPPALLDQHLTWATNYSNYQTASKRLQQSLGSLLSRLNTEQDMRDLLPEICYQNLPPSHELKQLPRSRPDLYAAGLDNSKANWDPRLIAQYASVAPLVDQFSGYSLLCAT